MKKNMYLYICIGVLLVFTIGYFVVANNISYAFVNDEETLSYNHLINDIKIGSYKYINIHEELFSESDNAYILVDDLVEEELIDADSDGKVKDPTNPMKNLNSIKIRLTKTEIGYDVKVLA